MATYALTNLKTGLTETFDFGGTRQEYIDQRFGNGGLNPTFATLVEVQDAEVVEEPVAKPKAKK